MTQDSDDIVIRPPAMVAQRMLALSAVTSRVNEIVAEVSLHWVQEHGIDAYFTEQEKGFYYLPQRPENHDLLLFSWRNEALITLMWALGEDAAWLPLNEQGGPDDYAMLAEAVNNPEAFIANAKLRAAEELTQAEGKLYQAHWQVRDAALFQKPLPPELNARVVYERRYTMSWVVGWGDNWDDVPTDT